MALKIPPSLKLSQIKSLAFQCGISTSGTKSLLTNRLINEVVPVLPDHASLGFPPMRVLSIDMGIRNLAYCILDLSSEPASKTKILIPSVTAWRRIAVSSVPVQSQDPDSSLPLPKEAFDPQTLSTAAYALLRHTLLPHNPTYVLIERQRFRSMGSPHILEWTVRVNMFESMLYAVLQTLKSEKIWHGTVVSILPGKVGPFWTEQVLPGNGPDTAEKSCMQTDPPRPREKLRIAKSAKTINKGVKIDLVRNWLEMNQMFSLGTVEAELTAQAYLEKWHRLPGRSKIKSVATSGNQPNGEEMGKLDDLADSLLQGMAWLEWEKNKRKVFEKGVEALDIG